MVSINVRGKFLSDFNTYLLVFTVEVELFMIFNHVTMFVDTVACIADILLIVAVSNVRFFFSKICSKSNFFYTFFFFFFFTSRKMTHNYDYTFG